MGMVGMKDGESGCRENREWGLVNFLEFRCKEELRGGVEVEWGCRVKGDSDIKVFFYV